MAENDRYYFPRGLYPAPRFRLQRYRDRFNFYVSMYEAASWISEVHMLGRAKADAIKWANAKTSIWGHRKLHNATFLNVYWYDHILSPSGKSSR